MSKQSIFKPFPAQLTKYIGVQRLIKYEQLTKFVPKYSERITREAISRLQLKQPLLAQLGPIYGYQVMPLTVFVKTLNLVRDVLVKINSSQKIDFAKFKRSFKSILNNGPMRAKDRQYYVNQVIRDLKVAARQAPSLQLTEASKLLASDFNYRPFLNTQVNNLIVLTNQTASLFLFISAIQSQMSRASVCYLGNISFRSYIRQPLIKLRHQFPKLTDRFRPDVIRLIRYAWHVGSQS